MPAPAQMPQYLYKIVPEAPPSPLPAEYPLSDLDRNDGFIHLSTAEQLPYAALEAQIRWDDLPAGAGCFPHLYGRNFGAADVEDARGFVRSDEGRAWSEVLGGDAWLS
ncbi:hypothetical protein CTA1_6819 [Colletotrichum tanaceti]|uniref:DUF952 domain-containing protein n=1 Tax=Colletotrichum tanaceti TaxID=1306861 RepID=A0A4U6XAL8_9PEZI|nr:hypothetical protein CTA1_6819 [Colletotrichum tanaceti]